MHVKEHLEYDKIYMNKTNKYKLSFNGNHRCENLKRARSRLIRYPKVCEELYLT